MIVIIASLKTRVHKMVNHLQAILGYIELNQYDKALTETKRAAKEVVELQNILAHVQAPAVVSLTDVKDILLPTVSSIERLTEELTVSIPEKTKKTKKTKTR